MGDAQVMRLWIWGVAASGGVVVVAAALLIAIWRTARAIEELAGSALATGRRLMETTAPIWGLIDVREAMEDLLGTVGSIEARGGALAAAVRDHGGPSRAPGSDRAEPGGGA